MQICTSSERTRRPGRTGAGHEAYQRFLGLAGRELSPLFPARTPFELAGYRFWTVESIWQGTKVIGVEHPALLKLHGLAHERLGTDGAPHAYWFPQAGRVRQDFIGSEFFRLLKSGRKYNRHRNRSFGLHNWRFDGHYDPRDGRRLDGETARARLHEPFYIAHLRQYPEALDRVRDLIETQQLSITEEMVYAHSHLRVLRQMLNGAW